jgi:cytochrome P450
MHEPVRVTCADLGAGWQLAEPNQYLYSVFNAGPRLCLGKPLALMEVKLVVGLLLRDFDFELAKPHAGGYGATIVLPMQPGLVVKLTPRTQ